MKVKFQAIINLEVEIDDDLDPYFVLEDNGCPGTGIAFLALKELVERQEELDTCQMCAAQCENKVVEVIK